MKSPLRIKLLMLMLFALLVQVPAFAQVIPDDPPPPVPLTGIEILIGAGALIGARKLARARNKK